MGQVHLSGQALPHGASPAFHQLCYRGHSFWAGGGGDWSTARSGQHLLRTSDPEPALSPVASRPDPLSTQKKPFSKGSQQAQAIRRHGEGRRDPGAGRGWHSRAAIRSPRGGSAQLWLQEESPFPRVAWEPGGARGPRAALLDSKEPALARGSLRLPAPRPACSLGPWAQLASHQQWSGASREPRQSRSDFKAGQRARWRLHVHTWLGRCRRLLCPARRLCPSGASGGQAQGAGTPRLTPAGQRERCQLGTRAAAPGGKSKRAGAGPAHTAVPLPAALRAGVHSPHFSSKEPEGKRLVNALLCQLSLKLVCRQPG